MSYTPTTIIPRLNLFQWSRPDDSSPRITQPLDLDDVILNFSNPPLDKDDAVIRGDFLMNVRNESGYTENIFIPSGTLEYDAQSANFTVGDLITGGTSGATGYVLGDTDGGATGTLALHGVIGVFQNNELITSAGGSATVNGTLTPAVSSDGLTATGVIRGVRLNGLDYTTSDPDLIAQHGVNSRIGCVISPVHYEILFDWILGKSTIASAGNLIRIGNRKAENISVYFENDHTVKPRIYWHEVDQRQKLSWGDSAPAYGDVDGIGIPVLTEVERDSRNWPDDGPIIVNFDTGEHQRRIGAAWIDMASGGSFPNASEATPGKIKFNTGPQTTAATNTDGGFPTVNKPSEIARAIQDNCYNYSVDSAGTDAFVIVSVPPISGYVDGQIASWQAGAPNNGASTLNRDGKGARHLKVRNYEDTVTGDIVKGLSMLTQMNIKTVTFNAGLLIGATSGTLLGNWGFTTGVYTVVFSNGDEREVTLTSGATTATWAGGLSGAATANAAAQYWQILSALAQNIPTNTVDISTGWTLFLNRIANWETNDTGTGSKTVALGSAGAILFTTSAANNDKEVSYRTVPSLGNSTGSLCFNHLTAGKKIIFEISASSQEGVPTNEELRFGFAEDVSESAADTAGKVQAKFFLDDGQAKVVVGDGSGALTTTNIAVANQDYTHIYRIEYTVGESVVFKVDNVVVHTAVANIPPNTDPGAIQFFVALKTTTAEANTCSFSDDVYIAIQK